MDLTLNHYSNFKLRFTTGSGTSDWHRQKKGIITGFTISVFLFALTMNIIVKSAEDLTITTTSGLESRWILQGIEKLIIWARMSFKTAKSRSLVLKRGKVVDRF